MSSYRLLMVVCLLAFLFGNAYGQYLGKRVEISPEITPGTVPVGIPVRIDLYYDNITPPLPNIYMFAKFWGTGGLNQAAPATPDSGIIYSGNVAVLNNFDANWNYGVYTQEYSWDGLLPDSFYYSGVGGWYEQGEQLCFSFFFRFLQTGSFCMELKEWAYDPPIFGGGPYCFNVVELGECADINDDGDINIFDVTEFIRCKYILDPPCEIPLYRGDVNNNGKLNIFDIVTIISYLYRGGPAPNCPPPPEP